MPTRSATSISEKGLSIIKEFEQLRLKAYKDAVGIATIGYGTTRYEDGKPVKMGEVITAERAEQLLRYEASAKAYSIAEALHGVSLNQNQIDAVVSLAYNIGVSGFLGSTAFKSIKTNPNDPFIRNAFEMWCKGTINRAKVVLPGLVLRRKKEADLYFSK